MQFNVRCSNTTFIAVTGSTALICPTVTSRAGVRHAGHRFGGAFSTRHTWYLRPRKPPRDAVDAIVPRVFPRCHLPCPRPTFAGCTTPLMTLIRWSAADRIRQYRGRWRQSAAPLPPRLAPRGWLGKVAWCGIPPGAGSEGRNGPNGWKDTGIIRRQEPATHLHHGRLPSGSTQEHGAVFHGTGVRTVRLVFVNIAGHHPRDATIAPMTPSAETRHRQRPIW